MTCLKCLPPCFSMKSDKPLLVTESVTIVVPGYFLHSSTQSVQVICQLSCDLYQELFSTSSKTFHIQLDVQQLTVLQLVSQTVCCVLVKIDHKSCVLVHTSEACDMIPPTPMSDCIWALNFEQQCSHVMYIHASTFASAACWIRQHST